ncbi:dienelactone hydrolase family protein [Celerinatantimonas sp. MCCC 1A17872]|uniref:dienelactone hydrolase family protein n=1 Tax=Celerinatantimonas sp. MCCC 1A17872 TaxID=3177514 RepID=UPI0038CBF4CE
MKWKQLTLAACCVSWLGCASAASSDYQTEALTKGMLPSFYPALKAQLTYPMSYLSGNYKSFAKWKVVARKKLRASLLTPDSHRAFDAKIIDKVDRGSYWGYKIAFNLTDESRVLGLMLVPKTKGKHAAAILLHDHGAKFDIGKEKMIKPWGDEKKLASAVAWSKKYFTGQFVGDAMAKRGYVVLCVDALGWGDRGPMNYEQQQALASNMFNLGRSLAGNMAYEDMRAFDFLRSRPEVDSKRVAIVGFSMGAYRAWQLAALRPQAVATVVDSWMGTYQGLMVPGNNVLRGQSSFYMLHPGLAKWMDIPDEAAIYAPKPMLIFNGGKDHLFPEAAVKDAYAKLHKIWNSQNAGSNLTTRTWPDLGHVFYAKEQTVAYNWLKKWTHPEKVIH